MSRALVIIDLQNDITKNYKDIIAGVNKAITWAVENDITVVYIKHNNLTLATRTFKPGTHGEELVPELRIVSENVFTKSKGNALTCKEFSEFIASSGLNDFIVAGADATACVKSTCFNMRKEGYAVTVLSDCVTSYDKRKIDEMLQYYEKQGCNIIGVDDLIKG